MSAADAAHQAARLTDPVEHGFGMAGMIAGLVLGAVVGVILIAATVATGGLFAIALASVAAVGITAGTGLAGGQLAHGLSTVLGSSGSVTGNIIPATSPDTKIGGLWAARAKLDGAICSGLGNHGPLPKALIATGSATVFINRMPAARESDKLVCAADIKQGFPTVMIAGGTVQVLPIHDNEAWLKNLLGEIALGALIGTALLLGGGFLAGAICGAAVLDAVAFGALFFAGNELLGDIGDALGPGWRDTLQGGFGVGSAIGAGYGGLRSINAGRPLLGEPVDGVTGEVCMVKQDLVLPGALELELTRMYASGLEHGSCFGPKWCSTWGQFVEEAGSVATYFAHDGRSVAFEPQGDAWQRHALVDRIRLRRSTIGYEVRDDRGRTLKFAERLGARWLLTSIEDRNGYAIRFGYDPNGALRDVRHSGGYRLEVEGTAAQLRRVFLLEGAARRTELIRYEYDAGGRLAAVIDGSGLPFRYEYDDAARVTRWQDRAVTWYEYRYDAGGRCVHAYGPDGLYDWRFDYDEARRTNVATDSLGNRTTIVYNQRLQLIRQIDARGGVTLKDWDERSNLLSRTDPEGRAETFEYDGNGNLTTAQDPLGRTTRILRDGSGEPVLLSDPAGRHWLRRYDERGNLIEAGLEGKVAWVYERDGNGNLVRLVDPAGMSRRFAHDAAGLPVLATDWDANIASFSRDGLGRIVGERDRLGRPTEYSYNALGKLAGAVLPDATRLAWEYDAEGNLVRRILADGSAYRYRYGAFDLLRGIEKPGGGQLVLDYDTEARLTEVLNERKDVYRYSYNETGQLVGRARFPRA